MMAMKASVNSNKQSYVQYVIFHFSQYVIRILMHWPFKICKADTYMLTLDKHIHTYTHCLAVL